MTLVFADYSSKFVICIKSLAKIARTGVKEGQRYNGTGVSSLGVPGAMAPPDFGRSVNPISTRGTDYAHLITTDTPGFSALPTALNGRQ